MNMGFQRARLPGWFPLARLPCNPNRAKYNADEMATWNPAEYARSSAPKKQRAQELLSRLDLNGSEAVPDMLKCGGGMSVFFE